jgi:hypothetical protein
MSKVNEPFDPMKLTVEAVGILASGIAGGVPTIPPDAAVRLVALTAGLMHARSALELFEFARNSPDGAIFVMIEILNELKAEAARRAHDERMADQAAAMAVVEAAIQQEATAGAVDEMPPPKRRS